MLSYSCRSLANGPSRKNGGKTLQKRGKTKLIPCSAVPQMPSTRPHFQPSKMETVAELGSDGRHPAPTNPAAMEDPRADAAAVVPTLAGTDALPDQVRSPRCPPRKIPFDGFTAT